MYGIGRNKIALIAENIVVDPPMPRATARMAIAVNPGVFTSIRHAYLRSRNIRPRVYVYMAEILTNQLRLRRPSDLRPRVRRRDGQCDRHAPQNGCRASPCRSSLRRHA